MECSSKYTSVRSTMRRNPLWSSRSYSLIVPWGTAPSMSGSSHKSRRDAEVKASGQGPARPRLGQEDQDVGLPTEVEGELRPIDHRHGKPSGPRSLHVLVEGVPTE